MQPVRLATPSSPEKSGVLFSTGLSSVRSFLWETTPGSGSDAQMRTEMDVERLWRVQSPGLGWFSLSLLPGRCTEWHLLLASTGSGRSLADSAGNLMLRLLGGQESTRTLTRLPWSEFEGARKGGDGGDSDLLKPTLERGRSYRRPDGLLPALGNRT